MLLIFNFKWHDFVLITFVWFAFSITRLNLFDECSHRMKIHVLSQHNCFRQHAEYQCRYYAWKEVIMVLNYKQKNLDWFKVINFISFNWYLIFIIIIFSFYIIFKFFIKFIELIFCVNFINFILTISVIYFIKLIFIFITYMWFNLFIAIYLIFIFMKI